MSIFSWFNRKEQPEVVAADFKQYEAIITFRADRPEIKVLYYSYTLSIRSYVFRDLKGEVVCLVASDEVLIITFKKVGGLCQNVI